MPQIEADIPEELAQALHRHKEAINVSEVVQEALAARVRWLDRQGNTDAAVESLRPAGAVLAGQTEASAARVRAQLVAWAEQQQQTMHRAAARMTETASAAHRDLDAFRERYGAAVQRALVQLSRATEAFGPGGDALSPPAYREDVEALRREVADLRGELAAMKARAGTPPPAK
jgi:uncharacterized protein (DUF1501 family)